jgi:hypothetical protein
MYCSRSVCGCMRVVTDWGVVVLKKEEENDDRPERDRIASLNAMMDLSSWVRSLRQPIHMFRRGDGACIPELYGR